MRNFVIIGQTATASADFSLDDLPGTSGRLDILLRCIRSSLLVSHGVRRDTVVYLVLLGGPDAPRSLRFDGKTAEYIRPDERPLAGIVRKTLAAASNIEGFSFVTVKPSVSVAKGGLDIVLADIGPVARYILDERGDDIRGLALPTKDVAYFVGDHLGFDGEVRESLLATGAVPIRVGPLSIHADDAIAVLSNELDRAI